MEDSVECEQCKETVPKTNRRQRFCSPYCRSEYEKAEKIRKWVERKPRKSNPDKGAKMEWAALYHKSGGWARKFTAVRG